MTSPDNVREQLLLTWSDLNFTVGEKQILKNVSGCFRPGELTAIMGPSGAGKSTMMNVLAGRAPYGNVSGNISLNGNDVDPITYRRKLAYVMQEDALFATQTPRECLRFTAALKLPELSDAEREKKVETLIEDLNLTRCADTLIGSVNIPGISGGEKKRTAVAVELISSPSLIFLDEPTSGLDSYNAYELCCILRRLAESGCTIVCTIHQPSSEVFDLFHRVMFLRLGQVVYNGSVDGIVEHFAAQGHHCKPNYNPADFAMQKLQTLTDDEIAPLVEAVTPVKCTSQIESMSNAAMLGPSSRKASIVTELRLLVTREFQQFIRDKMTLIARFGMNLFVALLCGGLYWGVGSNWGEDDGTDLEKDVNNHTGGLFFIAMSAMFLAVQPLLIVFPVERPVFMREYVAGMYSTTAYSISKSFVELPTHFLQQLSAALVFYFMMDLQGNFALLVGAMTLLAVACSSMGLLLGAMTTSVETAVNVMPALLVPQILFGGFFISIDSVPVWIRWTSWMMPLRYGFALVTSVEFAESAIPDDRQQAGDDIFRRYELSRDSWWWYLVALAGVSLALRVFAAIALARNSKQFR